MQSLALYVHRGIIINMSVPLFRFSSLSHSISLFSFSLLRQATRVISSFRFSLFLLNTPHSYLLHTQSFSPSLSYHGPLMSFPLRSSLFLLNVSHSYALFSAFKKLMKDQGNGVTGCFAFLLIS